MEIDYKAIGEQIRSHRNIRKITQEELSEMVSISPGYLSRLELGKKKASLETLIRICRALNITMDSLLVGNQILKNNDYNEEISELIVTCNEYERKIIYETIKATKEVMVKNRDFIKERIEKDEC